MGDSTWNIIRKYNSYFQRKRLVKLNCRENRIEMTEADRLIYIIFMSHYGTFRLMKQSKIL